MASPAYQISAKSTDQFKVISGTHTQTGDLISLLSFLENRLKIFVRNILQERILLSGWYT
jgi:hypothetical protein